MLPVSDRRLALFTGILGMATAGGFATAGTGALGVAIVVAATGLGLGGSHLLNARGLQKHIESAFGRAFLEKAIVELSACNDVPGS